jgi:hypothetical protein
MLVRIVRGEEKLQSNHAAVSAWCINARRIRRDSGQAGVRHCAKAVGGAIQIAANSVACIPGSHEHQPAIQQVDHAGQADAKAAGGFV